MKMKSIQQSILAAALLSTSVFAFASVLCPSVDLVQSAAAQLNTIQSDGSKYMAWTSNYAFNDGNLNWRVLSYVFAEDFNAALSAAQNNVKTISGQIDKYAIVSDFYVCRYSGAKDPVFAYSTIDKNAKLKFSSFNAHLFNLNTH